MPITAATTGLDVVITIVATFGAVISAVVVAMVQRGFKANRTDHGLVSTTIGILHDELRAHIHDEESKLDLLLARVEDLDRRQRHDEGDGK